MLEEFNLTWFEEPIDYRNHKGEAEVRKALSMPLASGESEYTPQGMQEMLGRGSVDVLMPDMQRMGGPSGFLQAAHLAEAYKVEVSSHLFHEMSLPIIACLSGAKYLEYMPWFEPIYRQHLALDEHGRAIVPTQPGWGFDLDMEAIAHYRT
jgi:L-alanine-DL-glutamate epimerase-like enolase superfamily enzyme